MYLKHQDVMLSQLSTRRFIFILQGRCIGALQSAVRKEHVVPCEVEIVTCNTDTVNLVTSVGYM